MNSKFLSVLAVFLSAIALAVSFVLPRGKSSVVADDTLAKIRNTGVIDACTVVNPPFSIKDPKSGERSGYNVDVLNLIAKKMDAKVKWHESTWGNIAIDLASNRCDLVAAELFANVPRARTVAFTMPPLFYIGTAALVKEDDPRFLHVKDISDFDKPDIMVAVSTGEAGDIFVKEHFKNAQVRRIDVESSDITRFILEVTAGRADVAIAGADVIDLYTAKHDDVVNVFKDRPFGINPVGWAVRQADTKWLRSLENSLQFLETQGDLNLIEKRYGIEVLHQVKDYRVQ